MTLRKKTGARLTEAEFVKLFHEVRQDINALQLHDEVFSGVVGQIKCYPRVLYNFPAFFGTFRSTVKTDMIIRLGRIYDPEGTGRESCTLARCLQVLQKNPAFFAETAITTRLSEDYRKWNPGFLRRHQLDANKIAKDLEEIERSRTRLIALRHKLYAHKDLDTILSGKRDGFLDSHDEVRSLIALAHDIWNHYSLIWNASTHSNKTFGADDYRWLFQCLRRGMKTKSLTERYQFERIQGRRRRRN